MDAILGAFLIIIVQLQNCVRRLNFIEFLMKINKSILNLIYSKLREFCVTLI